MAASNDNQGLKIAVAALVMLVFILGVTNYFAFSSASQMTERADAASKKESDATNKARVALDQANFFRTQIGYPNLEEFDTAKAQMLKDIQRITQEIQGIGTETATAINEVQKAGEPDPKLDELKGVGQSIVAGIVSEPNENKVYLKSLERMKDLLVNESRLLRELSLDYRKLRGTLVAANSINSVEVATNVSARDVAVKEKQDEISRIKTEVQSLYDQITTLQNNDRDKTNTITDLTNKLTDTSNTLAQSRRDFTRTITDLKDRSALNQNTLGKSIGRISFVDFPNGQVQVDVTKAQGIRPMMTFTVFDAEAKGIPTDKPKAVIQIISAGDPSRGENSSLARITETKDPINPVRRYDQIYSPVITPDNPERFALVGPIDMNRDSKDDRADLIRLIEQGGGLIEYDLPPPGVDRSAGRAAVERTYAKLGEPVPAQTGRAWGRLTSNCRAYIINDQKSLTGDTNINEAPLTSEGVAYTNERSAVIKEAHVYDVPPMALSRLLATLGYSQPTGPRVGSPGSIETKNEGAMKQVVKPSNRPGTPAAPASQP